MVWVLLYLVLGIASAEYLEEGNWSAWNIVIVTIWPVIWTVAIIQAIKHSIER